MKLSEMNEHQKIATKFIAEAMSDLIGGFENQLEDAEDGSEEKKEAEAFLNMGHEALVDRIYFEVMQSADKGTAKHARFAGTEFIKERISKRLEKWGY